MISKNKVATSIHVDAVQKKAMQLISFQAGVPMTVQIKFGINKYLQEHLEVLRLHGFGFDDKGNLIKVTK